MLGFCLNPISPVSLLPPPSLPLPPSPSLPLPPSPPSPSSPYLPPKGDIFARIDPSTGMVTLIEEQDDFNKSGTCLKRVCTVCETLYCVRNTVLHGLCCGNAHKYTLAVVIYTPS